MRIKTKNFTKQEMEQILNWLLQQRLENYGYDWRDFRRLSSYASKFRRLIRRFFPSIVLSSRAREGNLMRGRLGISPDGVEYTVGQSFNEEYINLMAEILERAGLYSRRKWLM